MSLFLLISAVAVTDVRSITWRGVLDAILCKNDIINELRYDDVFLREIKLTAMIYLKYS